MGISSHSEKPLVKKRLWNLVSVLAFLTRKCMVKRRYLQEGFMKTGKVLASNVRNIMFRSGSSVGAFGHREYEFSCSNTPAFTRPRLHNYFSCIRPISFDDDEEHNMREDILQLCNVAAVEEPDQRHTLDLCDGEELGTPLSLSTDVRVDREAEDFIAKFHSQIKFQRQISLLQYEEMLARGT